MDLLDLYHAHEHALSLSDPEPPSPNVTSKIPQKKEKKARYVPWEPYKAAPSADRKGQAPKHLPNLHSYSTTQEAEVNNNVDKAKRFVDERRQRDAEHGEGTDNKMVDSLNAEIKNLSNELEIERKLNRELKRLMVATISDELQGQVEALTEDKIRLAHRVEEYSERLVLEDEEVDQLRIDRDVWKCKFLAQSIRTDELTHQNAALLGMLKESQQIVRESAPTSPRAQSLLSVELHSLFARSPCETRIVKRAPIVGNITVSCCRRCAGREIYLL